MVKLIFAAVGFTVGYLVFGFLVGWSHTWSVWIAVVAGVLWLAALILWIVGRSSEERSGRM